MSKASISNHFSLAYFFNKSFRYTCPKPKPHPTARPLPLPEHKKGKLFLFCGAKQSISEMEQQKNMKRTRERGDYDETKNTKKQDLYGINFNMDTKNREVVQDNGFNTEEWDSTQLALGVFDFPWLKDGVVSKSENYYLDFEDEFSIFKAAGIDYSEETYCLCENTEASMVHFPEEELGENVWKPFESINGLELETEGMDCIWSSLLNQPHQQLQQNGGTTV
ncbi:DNA binding sequence-specific DNA binding transcription factors [Quillaja saponaria]|uniref:DNA binding sequence-specific DNA binding transcription factors n=1 Tax=Quillaja saponaria TaxID=32244 RepID=A0AAD7KX08_QUISA|nr:DNA binding sequence-specific DNA binding transcription factors [Quillaja saponaria]